MSLAWAAGDVSLVAFIQASLDEEQDSGRISALASVMACKPLPKDSLWLHIHLY